MTRKEGWEEKLEAYVAGLMDRPFSWGDHDCCQFARNWVAICTGEDPTAGLLDYDSQEGAEEVLKAMGWRNPYEAMRSALGVPVPPAQARRGDVVFAHLDGGDLGTNSGAGICLGSQSVFPGETGLVTIPTGQCARGWCIG